MIKTKKTNPSPFPRVSINTRHIRWRPTDSWEDADIIMFAEERGSSTAQVYRCLPVTGIGNSGGLHLAARWTVYLDALGDNPIGWAELQILPGRFNMGLLFYDFKAPCTPSQKMECLALVVTAGFLCGELDIVRVIPPQVADFHDFTTWGMPVHVATINAGALYMGGGAKALAHHSLIEVNAADWWNTTWGDSTRKSLHYLELRQKRRNQFNALKNKTLHKKRGGLLALLFGYRR